MSEKKVIPLHPPQTQPDFDPGAEKASRKNAPQWNYTQVTENQMKWPHWVLQWICVQLVKTYTRLNYKLTILGRENLPKDWIPCVVAANHSSNLDPPLVSVALEYRPIAYMAKQELFEKPLMRYYNWMMSSFAVNRERLELSTVKTALRILKHGKWSLGIFPEGTRSEDSTTVGQPKKGVAYFAKAAKVPIIPLVIVHHTVTDKNGQPKKAITIKIGQLIPPDTNLNRLSETLQQTLQSLADSVAV
ncbi:MAG: lysophospholipid acyltransferase family protein [Cyanobacteria bacterium P01_H01_bin.74]